MDRENHEEFINFVEKLYEKCKEYINENEVISPLRKNQNNDEYILDLMLQKDIDGNILINFYDLDEGENNILKYEEIKNKKYIIYPCINIEKIIINKDNKGYIQFTLKEAYIKFENKSIFDFNKVIYAYNDFII